MHKHLETPKLLLRTVAGEVEGTEAGSIGLRTSASLQ